MSGLKFDAQSPTSLKHGRHALMNEIDRLQWPNHHLELNDAPCLVPLDDVDSVDQHAIDLCLEFEHRVTGTDNLAHVAKRRIEEDLERCREIHRRKLPAPLRGVHDRRDEHGVIVEQRVQPVRVSLPDQPMPDGNRMLCHATLRHAWIARCHSCLVSSALFMRSFIAREDRSVRSRKSFISLSQDAFSAWHRLAISIRATPSSPTTIARRTTAGCAG